MARPHVECVDIRDLPWGPANLVNSNAKARQKVLSIDWNTRAASLYMQLEPGWTRAKGYHHADTEIYVIDGELTVGDHRLYAGCYYRVPKYKAVGPFESQRGATVLYFREGPPSYAVSHRDMGTVQEAPIFVDTNEMDWKDAFVPHDRTVVDGAASLQIKLLYRSPITHFYSRLVRAPAGWSDTRLSHHPVMEEAYGLEGFMDYNFGRMTPGTYFYRPPRIKHGNFRTGPNGFVFFCRDDGELVNLHTDEKGNAINYDPHGDLAPVTAEPIRSISFGDWDGEGM